MHSLLCHVSEMAERYGGLSIFTQQGLEKLNCGTTHDYFGSTNMMEQEAFVHVLQEQNPTEHFVVAKTTTSEDVRKLGRKQIENMNYQIELETEQDVYSNGHVYFGFVHKDRKMTVIESHMVRSELHCLETVGMREF